MIIEKFVEMRYRAISEGKDLNRLKWEIGKTVFNQLIQEMAQLKLLHPFLSPEPESCIKIIGIPAYIVEGDSIEFTESHRHIPERYQDDS